MSEIKKKAQGINPSIEARDTKGIAQSSQSLNIYEAIAVISKRSKQIAVDMKQELHAKLEEFASSTDSLEEIHENKEQIEISKFYERLPNPVLISLREYIEDKIYYRYAEEDEDIRSFTGF